MFNEATATMGGEVKEKETPAKPKTRAQRIDDWQRDNMAAYQEAQRAHICCSPTRQQMLLVNQWNNPPVD